MRILHVSPTYFSDDSFIGGGERYAYELARATAAREEVVFASFAAEPASSRDGALAVEHIRRAPFSSRRSGNPFSGRLLRWLRWADVIHAHQARGPVTDLAVLWGKLFRKKVFVTDLGGGERYALSYHLPVLSQADALLLVSEYSRGLWEQAPAGARPRSVRVVYGGVDTEKFSPGGSQKRPAVLFVGRLLPHKGVDVLIEAIDGEMGLEVVGRVYDPAYFGLLRERSEGKPVSFHTDVDDAGLVEKYRSSRVTVLPSVYRDCYGARTSYPELLGLAALESMACGTPVIVTDVASLPEVVEDGVTGFVVPPNDPPAIRERLRHLAEDPGLAARMGREGRRRVLERFSWRVVAERCLEAYALSGRERRGRSAGAARSSPGVSRA